MSNVPKCDEEKNNRMIADMARDCDMVFSLIVVNTRLTENNIDADFASMEDLLAYVKEQGYEWTSLVITVLPL